MSRKHILNILNGEAITEIGVLPLSSCRTVNERHFSRIPFQAQSVILFLIPYYTGKGENLSSYAVSKDYHFYTKGLFERICPLLEKAYEGQAFCGFSDHSPIDERDAVLRTGLAIKGDNRLLIHDVYGSFFFVGELFSTLSAEALGYDGEKEVRECLHCGACRNACPTGTLISCERTCLSALTQKKGELSEEERRIIRQNGTAWGCDACQNVCPYNKGTITPISFFHRERVTRLEKSKLLSMDEESFARRAFAWRGKQTVLRNLEILEEGEAVFDR